MSIRANHIMHGYWPPEIVKRLVLKKQSNSPHDAIEVPSRDFTIIKNICLELQKNHKIRDCRRPQNPERKINKCVRDFLKNAKRNKTEEFKKKQRERSAKHREKEREKKRRRLEEDRGRGNI
ncbi:hypothetical protein KQX54_007753 [Cotesia glomerata]|uniref:Uncharacterized protein n=1 Tax=Cotesia glomerata TaxID=32391 RepID=A0AAV7ITU4_COTGL|nr:hypothetical protein KQX54_007753 [Cotesia glomerata]